MMPDFETRFISIAPSIFITVEFGLNLHSNALCSLNIAMWRRFAAPYILIAPICKKFRQTGAETFSITAVKYQEFPLDSYIL